MARVAKMSFSAREKCSGSARTGREKSMAKESIETPPPYRTERGVVAGGRRSPGFNPIPLPTAKYEVEAPFRMKGLLDRYDKDRELRCQPSDDLQSSNRRSTPWGARMPISGERRFIKASGRIGLWFSSLLAAGLLFSVLFSLLSGGAGSILSIFLIFRVTMTFAFPVGCLYLPVLLAFRNREEKRMPTILLGGILIAPASLP